MQEKRIVRLWMVPADYLLGDSSNKNLNKTNKPKKHGKEEITDKISKWQKERRQPKHLPT